MHEFYKNADIRSSGLFILLCIMVLAAGVFTRDGTYQNSLAIFNYESLFIFLYVISLKSNTRFERFSRNNQYVTILLVILYLVLSNDYYFNSLRINYGVDFIVLLIYITLVKSGQPFVSLVQQYRLTAILLFVWLLSITISFYWSPLDLSDKPFARVRFWQTIMHVLFCIVLFDFLKKNRPPVIYLLMVLPISAVLIGFGFLIIYLNTPGGEIGDFQWFLHPPFQSHIRHVCYQITAGIAVLLPYLLINRRRLSLSLTLQYMMVVFLWTFLFWCGGRAAIASLIVVVLFLWTLLLMNRLNSSKSVLVTIISIFVAILISSWVSVFSWNGVFQGVARSMNAVSLNETENIAKTVNMHEKSDTVSVDWSQLTTGRTQLWKTSLDAVKNHKMFGLGSQSFYYLERKSRFAAQPHNLFVQFLIEWGLLGSLIFIVLLTMAFVSGAKTHLIRATKNLQPDMLAAGCIIITLTLQGLFDGAYYHPQPSFYLAIGFAVWLLPPTTSTATRDEA